MVTVIRTEGLEVDYFYSKIISGVLNEDSVRPRGDPLFRVAGSPFYETVGGSGTQRSFYEVLVQYGLLLHDVFIVTAENLPVDCCVGLLIVMHHGLILL